jgi:DNA polymerase-3 subunit beta
MTTATKTKTAGITLDSATLKAALADVLRAVPGKTPKPILHNVRLGDGLLIGTDLEIRIDREIDYHGEAILLPAAKLSAILKAATGDEVTITPKGTSVTVKCGGGKWELPTEDVAEFPTWEPADLKAICRLPADQFARAARATAYATDTESNRYALGGVLIDVTNGNPTWVATDGRRLSCVETETDQAVDDSQTIVPAKALAIAAEQAKMRIDGSVQVEASKSEVRFTLDGVTVTARLVEGKFPRWRDVVGTPEGEPTVLEVADLLQAVESAAIVTSEQSKGVDFSWSASGLALTAKSSEYGESRVKCDIVTPGSTSSTKLDPKYVSQFLSHIPSDEEPQVDVYATDPGSRVLLKCGPYTGVVMPLPVEG